MVERCHCHYFQCPRRLYGYTFPSPIYKKCRRCRRRRAKSIRDGVDHEFLDCETPDQFNFNLDSDVPDAILNQLCDGWESFLSVMELLYTFEDTSVDHACIIDSLLTTANNLSLSSKTLNAKMSVLERLIILSYIFKNR